MFEYTMEHLFFCTATLEMPPETRGPVPSGVRVNVYITGGKVEGPNVLGSEKRIRNGVKCATTCMPYARGMADGSGYE